MLNRRSIKTRLNLNTTEKIKLSRFGGLSRFIYNWGLERRVEYYREAKKTLSYPAQNLELTKLKKDNLWMGEISKWVGQDALRRLDVAYNNYFKSLKNKLVSKKKKKRKKKKKYTENQIKLRQHVESFPKLKKKRDNSDSFTFPASANLVEVKGDRVKLPKLGWLKTFETIEDKIKGRLLSATVSQEGEFWNISLNYEFEQEPEKHKGESVGIDLGIKTLATLSNGATVENPKFLKNSEKKLKREQRWLSRKKKGSKNFLKQKTKLQRVHRTIRNQRLDNLHKTTSYLTKKFYVICLEDLNIKGMLSNHKLAKHIQDCSFYEFKRQLIYKSELTGSYISLISRWFPSSKLCFSCGVVNDKLTLKDRTWLCDCGIKHDRDLNASRNIEREGLRLLV